MQTIQFLVLYFVFRLFWSDSSWYQDKEKEILFLVATYLVYLLVSWFSWLRRPLLIEINQSNNLGAGITQTIIVQIDGEVKTDQSQRTVSMEVKISRRSSIWWFLLKILIKNKPLKLIIEPLIKEITLQSHDVFSMEELRSTKTGFEIDVSELIKVLDKQHGELCVIKTYLYIIPEHQDIIMPANLTTVIQPRFTLESKLSKILILFMDFKTLGHEIKIFKK